MSRSITQRYTEREKPNHGRTITIILFIECAFPSCPKTSHTSRFDLVVHTSSKVVRISTGKRNACRPDVGARIEKRAGNTRSFSCCFMLYLPRGCTSSLSSPSTSSLSLLASSGTSVSMMHVSKLGHNVKLFFTYGTHQNKKRRQH